MVFKMCSFNGGGNAAKLNMNVRCTVAVEPPSAGCGGGDSRLIAMVPTARIQKLVIVYV
jgi:hypothetical protein